MTLQQLKYAVKVAEKLSINEAAKELYISQPSLSNAIISLEKELQLTIFLRTNRGVTVTNKGREFLGYAQQVLMQTQLLESKFVKSGSSKQRFCVSSQHYLFVANAFVELVREYGLDEYEFSLYETTTHEVIENVRTLFSEMGIIYLSNYNESVLRKILSESDLIFTELYRATPHVFLFKEHPLASRKIIELDELDEYPRIAFNQGQYSTFYFSEEILSQRAVKKSIYVSDRAAVVNFIIGLNGYCISSGIFPKYLHGDDIIAVPLNADEKIEIGTIVHKDTSLSELGEKFYEALKNYISRLEN